MTRRGDGLLIWMGATAIGFALYAPHVGLPSTLRELLLLIIVPCAFGSIMAALRALGDRL